MGKVLGQKINEFYNTGFPKDSHTVETPDWLEDFFDEDNHLSLIPTKKYDLSEFGYILDSSDRVRSFSSVFSKWSASEGTISLVVSVPEGKMDDFKQLIRSLPWVILKS